MAGHYKGECLTAWGRLGHAIPGWTKDGKRSPGEWSGGEPRRKVFKEWVKFLQDGTCVPKGKAEFAALKEAPDFEMFKERALPALGCPRDIQGGSGWRALWSRWAAGKAPPLRNRQGRRSRWFYRK